ncbi:MAG: pyruvate formate lyase family protein [Ruminiclostridium sp.]
MSKNNRNELKARILKLKSIENESFSEDLYNKRKHIYQKTLIESKAEPQIIRFAKCLSAFLHEREIVLNEEDILAGHTQFYDYSYSQPMSVEEEIANAYFQEKLNLEDEANLHEFREGFRIGLFGRASGGHIIAGYERVLKYGLGRLSKITEEKLSEYKAERLEFATASLIVCKAASEYILRYAAIAKQTADRISNTINSRQLKKIATACKWISSNPPRDFFEASQLLWLTHEIITCEQLSGSFSLGRIDQYLYPYYKNDISKGTIIREEASELIEALWIKLGGLRKGYQNVTLAGCDEQGKCAINELSYICLGATKKLKMDQPLISVRWTSDMPQEFWNEVQELIELGMGFPALFNDEVCISSKERNGIKLEEARNYGIIGCVEVTVPGKERSDTEGLRINWAKIIELMMSRGKCSITGETIKMKMQKNLSDIKDFQEFYDWYKEELSYFTDIAIKGYNIVDRNYSKIWPAPFLSSTMYGCIESGLDVAGGGTNINLSPLNGCGMANAVDSLSAIKKVVYDDKRISLDKMSELLQNDFKDNNLIRGEISRICPKYGNDNDVTDRFMKELINLFCNKADSSYNSNGGSFIAGFYSVEWHAVLGKLTGVLPDGRMKGMALANGLSSVQGADVLGPTALIKSLTKLDHRKFGNGMVLDLKFHPSFFKEKSHKDSFRYLIETYFKLGGMEIQINVVSNETLRNAQKTPDEYRDLIVRVSGFSAYFVELDKLLQDEIIARTEYAEL